MNALNAEQNGNERPSVDELRAMSRIQLSSHALQTLRWVAIVLASAVPLSIIGRTLTDLSGERTILDVNISIGISVAFALTGGGLLWRIHRQNRDLRRQRDRIERLTHELKQCQDAASSP